MILPVFDFFLLLQELDSVQDAKRSARSNQCSKFRGSSV